MNIYDIAEEAGVSVSTVSRVLNNHPNVKAEKRVRVQHVLKKNKFVRSGIARSLAIKATKTVGVLTVDIRHIHYASIAYAIEQKMSILGYNVILCNTRENKKEQINYLKLLAEKQVDGVVMVGSIFNTENIASSIERYIPQTPVVILNGTIKADNIYNITSSDSLGIIMSIDYLYKKGHRKFAFIQDYETWIADTKVQAFKHKMAEYGLASAEKAIIKVPNGLDGGRKAGEVFCQDYPNYSAIIGCEDLTAIGIAKELKLRGLRVPEDISIIGFNNSIYSQIYEPTLTSVDNKMELLATSAVDILFNVFNKRNPSAKTVITPVLVERESVGSVDKRLVESGHR
jgi:LacI family transcriptional regulator